MRVRFSSDDVLRFAEWSADVNPLHVDAEHARQTHFGQRVVHGVQTVLASIEAVEGAVPPLNQLQTVDIEFRDAVVLDADYAVAAHESSEGVEVTLHQGDRKVLSTTLERGPLVEGFAERAWTAQALLRAPRSAPVERSLRELLNGVDVVGRYEAAVSGPPAGLLGSTHRRVLALCSYVTGMELPGLRSLFTRIQLRFHGEAGDNAPLLFRARTVRFDRQFRLLDTEVLIADSTGAAVASGLLRSYVPFSPVATDFEVLQSRVAETVPALTDRVALVIGGSRGLGADITAALALAGARVYVCARHDDRARQAWSARLAERGASVQMLEGDASSAAWCRSALEQVTTAHGRLDVLVLNACAPPLPMRLAPSTQSLREQYVRDNLALVEVPLTVFGPTLETSGGTAVLVSSSYVSDPPAGFSHYVALKQAGEGLLRTAVREWSRIAAVIARPPVLQTRWNDTPAGIIGSIPADVVAARLVNALAGGEAGKVALLQAFPDFPDRPAVRGTAAFSLRLAASFTTDPLVPALEFWFRELDVEGAVHVAPYGQVLQSLLDPTSALNAPGKGLNVVCLRACDWLRELPEGERSDIDFVRRHLHRAAHDVAGALRTHRAQAGSDTVLLLCPSHDARSSAESILLTQAEAEVTGAAEGLPGLEVLRASAFHPRFDVDEDDIHDPLRDEIAHIPFRDEYLHVVSAILARQAFRRLTPPRKVVVVDCDNTLWKGVVGESGAEGIEFTAAHHALHRTLEQLSQAGVLVCLCSKNEEPDVWRVFETRPDLLLSRERVVAAAINWQPKSQNLRALAGRLNLGLDSFVFLDDNPVECAEVRAGCPEVLTLQWPLDEAQALRLLDHTWELDVRKGTKEDERRTQLYQQEFQRQELRATAVTFEDFIENLQLAVEFSPLAADDLRRAAQLTLRTNQFNFTTIRREESDVQALASDGHHEIRTIRVRDRFGDYGLVGLFIARRDAHAWTLDTFLLSCRVLGRGVEHRILADLGSMARDAGAATVRMRVDFTKRNTPARSFLESVIPAEWLQADDRGIRCDVPVEVLAAVRFEPAVTGEVVVAEEAGRSSEVQPGNPASTRRREAQVARTAFELATGKALRAALEGRGPAEAVGVSMPAGDIQATVHEAFARALRMTPAHVASVDSLESLGCDSLRIVEITVALAERFPTLPSTLLFEHRSVSRIVEEIARLTAPPSASPAVLVAPTSAAVTSGTGSDAGIAVVGMGVRCAGADSPEFLWRLLSERRTSITPVAPDRPVFLHPLSDARPHWAALLERVADFDAEFFGVSPREAVHMDPQLRLFLEVAWAALEDAGEAGRGFDSETGVFAGVMYGDYGAQANVSTVNGPPSYRCWEGFSLANRLSQLLGFHGPSLAVDTACSSSATALHLACTALRAGDCRVAIAGGVNLLLDPDRLASLGKLGILSSRGVCEPFGADADGTVLGEGAGVVVLRPLADALRRGDRIYGVIRGTGLSTGSGTVGFTAPNPQAQALAIRRAVQSAGIDPRTISYVETHGTGTTLGDPIEVRGLSLAYGDPALFDPSVAVSPSCTLGSIKGNIGHLEAGAGVVGLIKVLLQLQHRQLLPSITSAAPNPHIPFAQIPFDVQRELTEWRPRMAMRAGGADALPRRAGISSFGVGGANAHVIVEEAPARPLMAGHPDIDRLAHVLVLSARSRTALAQQTDQVRDWLDARPDVPVADACYSLNTGRKPFEFRRAVVGSNVNALSAALSAPAPAVEARAHKVAFLFTGQGAQYAGMGRDLYDTQPVFRAELERCASLLDLELDRPFLDVLFAKPGSDDAARLDQTGYTQPALFAVEYALAMLWQSWGIVPAVVMGHSVGEIAATCVAGGISLEDAVRLVAARGRLMQALPAGGVMTSVMAEEARVLEAIAGAEDSVSIAAINAPGQVVISGAGTAVAEITARLSAEGIKTKSLTVSHAFHSPLMKPMLAEYERVIRQVRFAPPRVPVVSCVDGTTRNESLLRPSYWLRQVMEPVRFVAGMETLQREGVTAYIETGPHPVLLGMARQCASDEDAALWLPSLRRDTAAWPTLLDSVATLFAHGGAVDWAGFDAPYQRRRIPVPAYAFTRREYWLPSLSGRRAAPKAVPSSVDLYDLRWERTNPAPQVASRSNVQWAIVPDASGFADALSAALREQGQQVTRLVLDSPDAAQGPLRGGKGETGTWRMVDLRALDTPNGTDVAAVVIRAVDAVRVVAQAAGSRAIWFVTRNAVGVPGRDESAPINVVQGAVWGLARTASLEHADVWGGIVDLHHGDAATVAKALALALIRHDGDDAGEDQLALSPGAVYVPRLIRATRFDGRPEPALTPLSPGTYLVTGGTGALGLRVAGWLVGRGASRIVLVSRRAMLDAAAEAMVSAWRSNGTDIALVGADVSCATDVERVLSDIRRTGSPLRGIVHAAGVDQPLPLAQLTLDAVSAVTGGKADGAWLLHERTQGDSLEMFIAFSSLASVLGADRRGHYAAANAVLDAMAFERRRLGQPITVVNWGPWRGGGMANPTHLAAFDLVGNRGLDPVRAMHALSRIVADGTSAVTAADIDWALFRAVYEARRPRPVLRQLDAHRDDTGGTAPVPTGEQAASTSDTPWVTRLRALPDGARLDALVGLLRGEVAGVLGFDDPEAVAIDRNFYDLGMDSMLMAELVGRLRRNLGMSCTALIFDHPAVHALAERLLPRLSLPDTTGIAAAPASDDAALIEQPASATLSEALAFQGTAFPERSQALVEPRWRWMFEASAQRLGLAPRFWLHKDDGRIVGQMGSIPVRLKVGGAELSTGWLVETMVLASHRSQAVGTRLMVQAHDDQPFSLSLGQTAEMREIQVRLGWKQVAPLKIAQMLLRPEEVLKGKLPAPAAWMAGLGLRASATVRGLGRGRIPLRPERVDRFGARHDALWREVSPSFSCAVVRDASYLNWKYVDQPGQSFLCIDLHDTNGLAATAVWMFRDADEHYRYRRASLVDLVAPMNDPRRLQNVIATAVAVAAGKGADALLCLHVGDALTDALRASGFHLRRPERYLLVDPSGLQDDERRLVTSGRDWYVTQGDSDIDRPW